LFTAFSNEAHTLAKLNHPNIVRCLPYLGGKWDCLHRNGIWKRREPHFNWNVLLFICGTM